VNIGIQIFSFTFPGAPASIRSITRDAVQYADANGFYSLWVMDHFFQMEFAGGAEREMLEGYTTLGYFAGLTERVKLGTLVTGVIYRHPGLLAKTVTTLDVLSGGRAYLGIGAAWYEREARALGVPYPPTAERFERLEEALQIVLQMWSGEVKPYSGQHYQLAETLNQPPALSAWWLNTPMPAISSCRWGRKRWRRSWTCSRRTVTRSAARMRQLRRRRWAASRPASSPQLSWWRFAGRWREWASLT
jgi:hypothetical protein